MRVHPREKIGATMHKRYVARDNGVDLRFVDKSSLFGGVIRFYSANSNTFFRTSCLDGSARQMECICNVKKIEVVYAAGDECTTGKSLEHQLQIALYEPERKKVISSRLFYIIHLTPPFAAFTR